MAPRSPLPIPPARRAAQRLRPHAMPILQTAVAAVVAWYIALALPLHDSRPVFASIAAVVALGVTYGRRGRRAVELCAGVMLGLTAADLIVHTIGTGPLQVGLVILLAMSAALLLGGGELLVTEAAVSALLLVSLEPATDGLSADRFAEALVGGAVALAVSSLVFPPSPALMVGRAAHAIFGELGWTVEEIAAALADGDGQRAERALQTARGMDAAVRRLDDALVVARETSRLAPPRRAAGELVERYGRMLQHLDYAVRNCRVLARHALRHARRGRPAPPALSTAVGELAQAVWALGAAVDEPREAPGARERALNAAARAHEAFEQHRDLVVTEIVSQVRSAAVDLTRAADAVAGRPAPEAEAPTEELLAAPRLTAAA
jgi:uncharacterized membrane protein YgaE (UPF0421/DUF939 family)